MDESKLLIQRIGLVSLMNLLTALGGVVLLPILTKNMPVNEYGLWTQVNVTVGLASVIILMGLPHSMVRFMAAAKERKEIQESFYSIFLLVALGGALVSLLLFYFSETLAFHLFDDNKPVAQILSVIVFMESLNALLFNFFRTFQQMKLYTLLGFINMCLSVALAYYFVATGWGIYGAVIGLFLSKTVLFVIMFHLIQKEVGFMIPNFRNIRGYLAFGLPLVPSGLSDWVINSSDRYVISIFLGTAYVGYYSPGYVLGSIIMMFINPVGCILPVVLSKHYDEDKLNAVETILSLSLRYFLALALPAVFGLTILSWPILSILSTTDIADKGYLITPFVALSMLLFGIASILANIIGLVKRTKISAMIWFIAATLNIGLTIFLVPRLNILGAALATLLAFIFVFASTVYFTFRLLKLHLDTRFILKCLLASMVMSLFIILWSPKDLQEILASIALSAGLYFLLLWLLKGINEYEVQFLKKMLRKGS